MTIPQVQLDTGSSDLWINTQNITLSPQANDTNITVTIPYAYVLHCRLHEHNSKESCRDTTDASGDVFLAPVQFGNFSIPSQAFSESARLLARAAELMSRSQCARQQRHLRHRSRTHGPRRVRLFPHPSPPVSHLLAAPTSPLSTTDSRTPPSTASRRSTTSSRRTRPSSRT